jgi:hypothetical protein
MLLVAIFYYAVCLFILSIALLTVMACLHILSIPFFNFEHSIFNVMLGVSLSGESYFY